MKVGKLNWDDLKCLIDNKRGALRNDVRMRSSIGEDCAVVNFGDYECVISTDPITGAVVNPGKLAVHINCNDIASCGVEPIGIMVTILAPEHCKLEEIALVMGEVHEEAKALNVEILGGHTEITRAVNKMIISCTVIGKTKAGKAISTSGARLGDDIIVTKQLCLEGTSIVAHDYEEKINKILSPDEIQAAKAFSRRLSVVKEGKIAGEFGVNSMHDITEGGVLGALWEMAKSCNLGFKVFQEKMPLSYLTEKLCREFSIDPLRFISSGSMLITTERGEALIEELKNAGIEATIIGMVTKDQGILVKEEGEFEVTPPERDELFKLDEKIRE